MGLRWEPLGTNQLGLYIMCVRVCVYVCACMVDCVYVCVCEVMCVCAR